MFLIFIFLYIILATEKLGAIGRKNLSPSLSLSIYNMSTQHVKCMSSETCIVFIAFTGWSAFPHRRCTAWRLQRAHRTGLWWHPPVATGCVGAELWSLQGVLSCQNVTMFVRIYVWTSFIRYKGLETLFPTPVHVHRVNLLEVIHSTPGTFIDCCCNLDAHLLQ